jgi:ABC-type transport system involved in multi-copper enzyme maturation permease subunit
MFWNLLLVEQTKIFRRLVLWVEVTILALLVGLIYLMLFSVLQLPMTPEAQTQFTPEMLEQLKGMVTWPLGLIGALSFAAASGLGGLLTVVLVGALTAQEYSWRTLPLWLSQGISRPALLAAKFLALLLPILLLALASLAIAGPLTAYFTIVFRGQLDPSVVDLGQLALAILRTAYTLLPYAALTFLLAVATRSTVASIAAGVGYALVIELLLPSLFQLLGGWVAQIWQYLPGGLAAGLLQANAAAGRVTLSVGTSSSSTAAMARLDPWPAALGIALYTLVFVVAAVIVFRRQDLASTG